MLRTLSLSAFLLLFWLGLSGQDSAFLVTIGVIVSVGSALVASRMSAVDAEGHAVHLLPRAVLYWPWLALEILKSAWTVTLIIIDPRLPISPTLTRVRAGQTTAVGLATYANSITLTPGTITTEVSEDELIVHAIERQGAIDLESGEMNAMVNFFEGSS
ncbi:MAG: Na+/H+ antiporter subunit E [Hyphomicrobiaceae bacterium]